MTQKHPLGDGFLAFVDATYKISSPKNYLLIVTPCDKLTRDHVPLSFPQPLYQNTKKHIKECFCRISDAVGGPLRSLPLAYSPVEKRFYQR